MNQEIPIRLLRRGVELEKIGNIIKFQTDKVFYNIFIIKKLIL
jgi:hypothetical protein